MEADLGGPVHYLDLGGPEHAPRVVYVHGLGGSHLNWLPLAPLLRDRVRAFAVDLPGFGRTAAAGRKPTVAANARVLRRFVSTVVGPPVILVGNSMGGLVSLTAAAAEPALSDGLVLIDPVLPLARGARVDPAVGRQFFLHGVPFVGEWVLARRYATVPARQRVAEVLARCCLDASLVPVELVEDLVALEAELTAQPEHAACHLTAARSIVLGLARPGAYWRMTRALTQPVLLLHGTHDRLVPIASARAAAARHPQWTFVELDAGHIPQMETPGLVADAISAWLTSSHRGDGGSGHAPCNGRTNPP